MLAECLQLLVLSLFVSRSKLLLQQHSRTKRNLWKNLSEFIYLLSFTVLVIFSDKFRNSVVRILDFCIDTFFSECLFLGPLSYIFQHCSNIIENIAQNLPNDLESGSEALANHLPAFKEFFSSIQKLIICPYTRAVVDSY